MGTFATKVRVGNPAGGDTLEVEALVDTGASHSMFPASLLDGRELPGVRRLTARLPTAARYRTGPGGH